MPDNYRAESRSGPTGTEQEASIRGVLDHITFHNEENGYTVARLQSESGVPVIVVGTFSDLNLGETIEAWGEWTTHPSYGPQFRISSYRPVIPSSTEGIKRYLGSGLIKGLGEVTAQRIVDHFGDETLEIIEKHPGRLKEVDGLGPKRIRQIRSAWREHSALRDVMIFLQGHGVNPGLSHKIYKRYGADSVAVVRSDPYRLASDIWGVGFRTADQIAREVGIQPDDPKRLQAGLAYVVQKSTEQGHTFIEAVELVRSASEQLDVTMELLDTALDESVSVGLLVREDERIALPEYVDAEKEAAERLMNLTKNAVVTITAESDDILIERVEKRTGVTYAEHQREAILAALKTGVLVITGGPGTGKTTTTNAIVEEISESGAGLVLCAPTGRAAKRLSEVTGTRASTIHRLLGYQPEVNGFQHNEETPLEADVVLIDEASMVDTRLFVHVLRALKPGARLILVGDVDQLPSVGAGQVLRDVIDSGTVTVVRLSVVFRQASESRIITNAHRINQGEMPNLKNVHDGDFFFLDIEHPEEAAETIVDLVTRRLPERYDLDPVRDIQVLTPMYRGATGANALNARMQAVLTPEGDSISRGKHEYRVGDKVIITRNNYTKMVYNGDIGRVADIDEEEGEVRLELDQSSGETTSAVYETHEMDEFTLAYAVSVHRSQGSEFPVAVLPVTTEHYLMLQRNVLYTAVTRARRMVVIVGSKKALAMAVNNSAVRQRNTWLTQRLKERKHLIMQDS